MAKDRIVAVGLLTQGDLDRLGNGFRNVIPVARDSIFDDLLAELDRIEVEPADHGVMLRSDHHRPDHHRPVHRRPDRQR